MKLQAIVVLLIILAAVEATRKSVNVATGKPVKARGRIDLFNLIDGDKETCSDTRLLVKPVITVDLRQPYTLNRIKLRLTEQLSTQGLAKVRIGNSTTISENPICARVKQRKDGVVIASKCTGVGRYVTVQKTRGWGDASLCEIEAMTPACEFPVPLVDSAAGKHFSESSDRFARDLEVMTDDINFDDGEIFFRGSKVYQPSWKVDLGEVHDVYEVILLNKEPCYYPIMESEIRVGNDVRAKNNELCHEIITRRLGRRERVTFQCGCQIPLTGRYVSGTQLKLTSKMLHVCALKIMTA